MSLKNHFINHIEEKKPFPKVMSHNFDQSPRNPED